MRMKKLLAAALAGCTALSAVSGTAVFAAKTETDSAPELMFDFQGSQGNEIALLTTDLEKGDVALNLKMYVPSNPGVNCISLKLQINDGEISEDNIFQNYGFTLSDAKLANPYCFDSENEGDSAKSFQPLFTADAMNLSWVYRFSQDDNADSSSEAGTTVWNSDVSWAYDRAFAEMTLNVPQGTPAGDYVLDIRRDTYVNSVTLGGEKQWLAKSACTAAGKDDPLEFSSKPFTVHVVDLASMTYEIKAENKVTPAENMQFTVGEPLDLSGVTAVCDCTAEFSDKSTASGTITAVMPKKAGTGKSRVGDTMLEHYSKSLMIPLEMYLDTSAVDSTKAGTYPVTLTVEGVGIATPYSTETFNVTYAAETELTTSEETTTEITTTTESATTSEETTAEITTTFDLRDLTIDALTAKLTLSKAATKTAYKVGEALSLSGMKVTADYAVKFNDGSEVTKEKQAVTIPAKPETAEKIRLGGAIALNHASETASAVCEVYLDATAVNTKKAGTYPVKLTVEALGGEVLDTLSFDVTYEEEPVETTAAPVETTTAAPVETTAAPVETTTVAPVETTAAPTETTTVAPVETTVAPIETTTGEGCWTTVAPIETTTVETFWTTEAAPVETTTVNTTTWDGQLPLIENKYDGMAEGMYLVVGDVSGAPGSRVKVPVYVYNDPGTAGMTLYWVYTDGLKISRITDGDAYLASTQPSSKTVPISYVFTCPEGKNEIAKDGAVICYITVTIPEDAKDGTVYKFEWIEEGGKSLPDVDKVSQACDLNGIDNKAKFFPGTVTVNAGGEYTPRLNYSSYSFTKKGEQVKLAVLDAHGSGLRWHSTDESVATVDDNGLVTAQADTGSCTIQAEVLNGGGEALVLNCDIHIGLFGDVDGDGTITAYDAQLALIGFTEDFLGFEPEERTLTPEQEIIADVDLDGELTAYDATVILTYFSLKYNAGFDDLTWEELLADMLGGAA
ncbi:MAG: Ig-like domain-containing protein [Oscillospiraceae bacterium]|nr:Ig-like domain-containing protein [Oscillospiraceae bacterium]